MKCSRATERRAIAFLKMVMDVLTSVYIRFHRESPHQRCSYTIYRYCSQDINVFSVFCRAPSVFSKHLVIPLLKPLFHHCEVVCSHPILLQKTRQIYSLLQSTMADSHIHVQFNNSTLIDALITHHSIDHSLYERHRVNIKG